MEVVANLQYTADLIADVLFRAGERTDGSSQYAATALSYLNRAYLGIAAGGGELVPGIREEWRWLKNTTPGVLSLLPVIAPGIGTAPTQVNATFNTASITFSGMIGENLVSLAGWSIKIGDNRDIFRIISHTINTGVATLDGPWTGPSGTYTYVTGKFEYALASDVLRIVSPMRAFLGNENENCTIIHEVDPEHMYGEWPVSTADSGMPEAYTRVTEQLVRFNRYAPPPSEGGYTHLYRVEYDYIKRPTLLTSPGTTEEPLVPWEWRRVLSDWALFWLLIDKNDDRSEGVGLAAKSGLEAMAHENQYQRQGYDRTPSFGKIEPRAECWGRS
jgi:hypothetical protein